jgi:hypothetical protein
MLRACMSRFQFDFFFLLRGPRTNQTKISFPTGFIPEVCDLCGGVFKSPPKRASLGFKCLRCNATFEVADKFIAHSALHTRLRPFRCTDCERTYTRRDRLRRHMKTDHSNELHDLPDLIMLDDEVE